MLNPDDARVASHARDDGGDVTTEEQAPSSQRVIEQQLLTLYRRTNSVHVETSHGDTELDRSTYGILCLLDDIGPMRLGAIAATYHLNPSTVTRQAQAAVRLGLAEKRPDPDDGRAALLALTPEGETAIRQAREHRRTMLEQMMSDWSTEERDELARSLQRFNAAVDRWVE